MEVKITFDEVKVGDRLLFNDGREKLKVKVTKINKRKGDGIDVTWKRGRTTFLLESDFKNGYVKKIK